MELFEGLLTRRSVRQFDTSKTISQADLQDIIKAAQHAPSAHNKQPWEFLVLTDKEKMTALRHVQPWTSFAKDASAVVLVCGNTDEAFSRHKEDESWNYSDIDCALATQNLLLAAHSKGIGGCFCGAAPMPKVIAGLQEMFELPDNIRPLSIVILGYPKEEPKQPTDRFKQEKIHWEKW